MRKPTDWARARAAAVASAYLLLAFACGSRTDLARATTGDASASDAAPDADVPDSIEASVHDANGIDAKADATLDAFRCGEISCSDSRTQYCLTTFGGCESFGAFCTNSDDCCSGLCEDGVCGAPGDVDGAVAEAGTEFECAALPSDCKTSPPTCACVLQHQPCGPVEFPVICNESDGVVTVDCETE